jgi:hypothetical protein
MPCLECYSDILSIGTSWDLDVEDGFVERNDVLILGPLGGGDC